MDRSVRGVLPLGAIGMLALIVAFEGFVARHDRIFTTIWATQWRLAGEAARTEAQRCGVLCFGDSLMMHGIIPPVLERGLGRRCLNLAIPNGQAPASYFQLRRALARGARPTALLIDGELFGLDQPLDKVRLWSELLTIPEGCELAWTSRDPEFFVRFLVARLLPSARTRYEVRDGIQAALRGLPVGNLGLLDASLRNRAVNRGACVLPSPPKELAFPGESPSWSCHPINAHYLKKFLALADGQKIPVFWLLPPVHPEFQARRDRLGRDSGLVHFAHRVQARFPNVTILDGRHAAYRSETMADQSHLNRQGAIAFSVDVAANLAARLGGAGGPRWVALPPYREHRLDITIEDFFQSALAGRNRPAAIR